MSEDKLLSFCDAFLKLEKNISLRMKRSYWRENENLELRNCRHINDFRIFKNIGPLTFLCHPSQIDILAKDWTIFEVSNSVSSDMEDTK